MQVSRGFESHPIRHYTSDFNGVQNTPSVDPARTQFWDFDVRDACSASVASWRSMQGVAAWRYGIVVAHHERPLGDLGQALAAPARGKRRRQDGVLKINRDRV